MVALVSLARLPRGVAGLLALALIAGGCAHEGGTTFFKSTPNFYQTAQENYEYANKELSANNPTTAEQYFQHVRNRFGFSKWATLSELGLADCLMAREKFVEAADAFKQFVKQHPANERVTDGYASFRAAEAYYRQIPSDWFLAPPSYEKDQGPIIEAMREMGAFVEDYKDSPHQTKARELLRDTVRRLTDHELYVAKFYLDRDHPQAAVDRLEGMVREYPGAQREPEVLLLLGKTYLKMKKTAEARGAFEKLAKDYPADYRAHKARLYLEHIEKNPRPKS